MSSQKQRLDAKKKLQTWVQMFRYHKTFQQTDIKLSLAQQKPSENPLNKVYVLKLKHIGNLKVPQPNPEEGALPSQQKTFQLQMNVTLFNPQTGFFGRTYRGKLVPLKVDKSGQEFQQEETDWTLFYTQSEALETQAIVEIILVETDRNNFKRTFGIGYAPIRIFLQEQPVSVEVYKGTPRDAVKLIDPSFEPMRAGCIVYYEFKQQPKKHDILLQLIPDNCLVGANDILPGIVGSKLSVNPDEILTQTKASKIRTVYAHNIRISSMNEVEKAFLQYLKDWKQHLQMDKLGSDPQIQERKLSVVPHNSWRPIGSQSFVSLNKELNGLIQSSGAIKILNFPMHPLVSLILKLEYRVSYMSESGRNESRDFILGWCAHIPTLNETNDNLKDEEVQCDLILGPGITLLGDILWDQTLVRAQNKLLVKVALMLTTSEDMVSEAEKKRQEEILIKEAQAKIQEQLQKKEEEKREDYQKLKQIQEENERLRREKEELESKSKKPSSQLLEENIEHKEITKAKEYYTSKNDEIEQLIQQVLKGQKDGSDPKLPDQIMEQGEQSIASLLRFLIQIVLQNYGPEAYQMQSEARQEMTKKNLMELLKGDQNYKMNVFGSQGGMSMLQSKELSRQDKINLLRLGVGKNLLDKETEAKLLASEPRMDIEVMDQYKASTITFKFVAMKTPMQFGGAMQIPQKLYFTFKFFTFKTTQTEKVLLKLPPEIEQKQNQTSNQSQINNSSKIRMDTQYYLMKLSALQQQEAQNNLNYAVETGLQLVFDIDPSISKVPDENLHLSRYLKERVLTIDVWNGDSLMHYGTCKVPLHQILRQGDPTKVIGQEYDICDPDFGGHVGGLQLLITNEGRKIHEEDSQPSPDKLSKTMPGGKETSSKHKKKVLSKPIENLAQTFDDKLSSLAQAYEFQKTNVTQAFESEEARKKLRVDRLKRTAAAQELSSTVNMSDPTVNEWQKMQSLKQIEMLRQTKKSNLLNQVMKESMQFKQTLDVIPGQVQLIHFLVHNPFPSDEVFSIQIIDPDEKVLPQPELSVVHNENKEWQFWFNQSKCAKPSEWDLVSSRNDVILGSGQQCPLLLKFLSFREPVSEAKYNKEQQSNPLELRPRKIKIVIQSKDKVTISTMEVRIVPREQYCDQIFRYYEPQNCKSYLKIPKFVPFDLHGMHLVSSNKEIKADINQEGEIFVVLSTQRAPQRTDGYVYLYQDQFFSQLLACCKVEVYSLTCVRQKLQAGPEVTLQLQVRSNTKRTIEIYSSNPRLVFPPAKKERNICILQPNEMTSINIAVKSNAAGTQRARIHCVDINTKELVQAWLFEIEADKPLLQKAYQIELQAHRHYPYKFSFSNPLAEFATLEFVSSKPGTMQVRREKLAFESYETKQVELYFPAQNKASSQEAILYINDESGRVSESLLFKVIAKE